MSADEDLLRDLPAPMAGEIAAAPTTDGVMVLLPQLDGGSDRHGPCPYTRQPDVEPRRGDRCVVIEDDRGGLWVVGWWPA